jgi:hypothetical protein
MRSAAACPEWSAKVGDIIDRPEIEARSLIEGHYASEVVTPQAKAAAMPLEPPMPDDEPGVESKPNQSGRRRPR